MKEITGLNDYQLFFIVHKYLVTKGEEENCDVNGHRRNPNERFRFISTQNQLLLTLFKLRSNHTDVQLADEFSISYGKVSEIFRF